MTSPTFRRLGEVIEVKHGFAFDGAYFCDSGPYRLLTPGNFAEAGGFVDRGDKQKYYDGPVPKDFVLSPGSLLVAMTEQAEGLLGSSALVPSEGKPCLHNQRLGLVRPLPSADVDVRFLYYLFNTSDVRRQIRATASGAKVRHTAPSRITAVVACVPELPVQRRIASILGAYDDLIEVNRRRIAVLEEMARRLFEEWFVHFRFPGHDQGTPIPSGDVDGLIDFDPATQLPRSGKKPFIPMTLLSANSSLIESHEWREAGSGAKFKNGDTLFARITPCLENGKTGLVRGLPADGVGFGSTEFIVMRGRRAGPAFTYLLARHEAFRFHAQKSMSGATGRQRARTESLRTFSFVNPTKQILDSFDALTWPMLELVGQLGEANKRLGASRDLLLPRLISGDLPVTTAERELEAIA